MPPSEKSYDITARSAARRLGVCLQTIHRWARTGRVPAERNMSGYWMFSIEDLDAIPVRVVRKQVDG